jgi:Tol biopolymer transport system component
MKKYIRAAVFIALLAVAACAAPMGVGETQPSSNQVATTVALTLQALESGVATTPEAQSSLLPRSLYFLGNDSQGISQVYRLERDGTTRTQLTFETVNVWDYDVSRADGNLAYEANNQLVLVNADGTNRRVLAEGTPNPDAPSFYSPTFSPDGQTLAYAHNGLNLYAVSTGASSLVLTDQVQDPGDGSAIPVETYSPESYSPDGTKLLVALGHWEVAPSHAVYDPATNGLIRHEAVTDYIYCCSFHGGPAWSPDGSSFYGVASVHDTAYKSGQLWRVEAANGAITRMLTTGNNLPREIYPAPDGQLYFFLGTYTTDSGFFDAPVLELVRSAPDGMTDRTVLREVNFVLMNEALWAPDASFVIVATSVGRDWNQEGGVLQLYDTQGQKDAVWLTPFGKQLKWGP